MKHLKNIQGLLFAALLAALFLTIQSCNKKDDLDDSGLGTISGMVSDASGNPVSGVSIKVSALNNDVAALTNGDDGKFMVDKIEINNTYSITFSKTGWLTISITITPEKFDKNGVATANVTMVNASAKITGTVTDAKNSGAPLAGVNVSISATESVTTGNDGVFLFENLIAENYTLTFSKENYATVTKALTVADFVDGVATIAIQMGSDELLRGLTASDLAGADKWYYNEYRGGRNADAYPRWDWACDYMCALDFRGAWEEQNEGTILQIRNSEGEQNNPADLDVFDSYVFGSKLITTDNKILSLRVRTHDADETAPVYFGVQVIDLSAAQPVAEKIGETNTYSSGDYADFDFDLGNFMGKEVIIAVGIYRKKTGNYFKQLVIRAFRFAAQKVEGEDWLPGTEVANGWKLTRETVKSTMPQTKSSFTGISPVSGNRDNYVDGYRSWRDVAHVAAEWAFVPLKKDPEVFPSEGYIIKTRNTPEVNTLVPEAYLYAKFAIAPGKNKLTLNTRNFGDNYTYFRLTAIDNNGTVTHIQPQSNTAQEASAADDGCWKFKHGDGSAGNPEGYASFVYDLSQFNSTMVVLVLGVYNGAADTGENKLAIHSINLD
ncbi:MAG: carboxypeptidase regulatory-like domain-containing protein [Bacteroidales bacterium]|nr:carboxypeptidase regulatory-like domain-containing protein [Bacteroidales bacterium]